MLEAVGGMILAHQIKQILTYSQIDSATMQCVYSLIKKFDSLSKDDLRRRIRKSIAEDRLRITQGNNK